MVFHIDTECFQNPTGFLQHISHQQEFDSTHLEQQLFLFLSEVRCGLGVGLQVAPRHLLLTLLVLGDVDIGESGLQTEVSFGNFQITLYGNQCQYSVGLMYVLNVTNIN